MAHEQLPAYFFSLPKAVLIVIGRQLDVAKLGGTPIGVEHHHWYVIVVVEHLEHQVQVGILVGIAQRAHGLGPHLHLALLLFSQVARQIMRHQQ